MIMKKFNAVITWLITLFLLIHVGIVARCFLFGTGDYIPHKIAAEGLATCVFLHIIMSIIMVLYRHEGKNFFKYAKVNKVLVIQRVTGFVIMIIVFIHMNAFKLITLGQPLELGTKIFTLVTETIFFLAICIHLAYSFSKSLITMGLIRTENAKKKADIAAKVVCGLLFLVTMVSIIGSLIVRC